MDNYDEQIGGERCGKQALETTQAAIETGMQLQQTFHSLQQRIAWSSSTLLDSNFEVYLAPQKWFGIGGGAKHSRRDTMQMEDSARLSFSKLLRKRQSEHEF